jgi:predicted ATPase
MPELPTGTVTLLFTDIEGSTRLLHELGSKRWAEALAEHRRLLREAFARQDGVEIDTQGDAFFYAFPTAPGAVQAAHEGQEALASGPIRVRIGLHTGTPHLGEEGYVGEAVHLGARIAASAHGGQVVFSKETRSHLDDAVSLLDLGEHRLKDFSEPVWIYQLGSERFPPLKTISNTNLPRPASSFVGRDREVSEVVSLLREGARFVTLSGPGGSGKTRLAIEAAAEVVPAFKNGVFWVGLAALREPTLVSETIAQTLGAKESLREHIGERELLLLLDNLEQVLEAAPELALLLEACPNLCLLVTSRELLRVRGEVEYAVPPLAEPEAVELFCARAQLEPDETIAELCTRLDNLPLAVELAAARTSVLSPKQTLQRLSQRLDLLRGGRDAEARQQTLRATIAWSYELLSPTEQRLFARLAVFAGGCTLEAAEEVAEADLDTLQSLVDKSLLRHTGERFWMLETIREYAGERLEASGEDAQVRTRHAEYCLRFAKEADAELRGPKQAQYLARLEAEHDNMRAAFTWLDASARFDATLALASALGYFWLVHSHFGEARRKLGQVIARRTSSPALRTEVLIYACEAARMQGHYEEAVQRGEEALQLARDLDLTREIVRSLRLLAGVSVGLGDLRHAEARLEEARQLADEVGDAWTAAAVLSSLADLALNQGAFSRAVELCERTLEIAREIGDTNNAAVSHLNLAYARLRLGQAGEAVTTALREAIRTFFATGDVDGVALCVDAVGLAVADRAPERAGRLLGAAGALRHEVDTSLPPFERSIREDALTLVRVRLVDGFDQAVSEGGLMAADEAVAYALDSID